MACRLAIALKERNPQALLAELDEVEFQFWCRYYDEEPFGAGILNLMLAQIAAACVRGPTNPEAQTRDFLPRMDIDDEE